MFGAVVTFCFGVLAAVRHCHACAGGIGGGGVLTNPSISMKFNPPTSWTYPTAGAEQQLSFFPGQSMTLNQAQLRANGDLSAAVIEALTSQNIPIMNAKVVPTYTPPQVNDCGKGSQTPATQTPAGAQFGIEEGGAIVRLASISTGMVTAENCITRAYVSGSETLTYQPFIQQATVKIDNLVLSEYQMQQVSSKVMSVLMLNSKVDFTEEPIVS